MKKKIAIVLTSLLMLTVLLTTPYFMPSTTAEYGEGHHWKIELAQKKADAFITGYLIDEGGYIPDSDFELNCTQDFVFWKVWTPTNESLWIHFDKLIDWDKDGVYEQYEIIEEPLKPEEPGSHCWLQHVETPPGRPNETMKLHTEDLDPMDPVPKDPYCTWWHELYPLYCNWHHCADWEDNGDGKLSCCDQIKMEWEGYWSYWYHVEEVTVTLNLTDEMTGEPMYIEWEPENCSEGIEDFPWPMPICTWWHEAFPVWCQRWHIMDWLDDGDGYLDFCDIIWLENEDTGELRPYHVEGVGTDILVHPPMVVVEVHEQPYDEERPYFEWQLTIKQENCNALWKGILTNKTWDPIEGANFTVICNCTKMQCVVVRTPWCTVPHDIAFDIYIFRKEDSEFLDPIAFQSHHEIITQFPWTMVKNGTYPDDPGKTWRIELELTEVQMHTYYWMGITTVASQHLAGFPPTFNMTCKIRPLFWHLDITFTQKDPITGIVKLGIPAQGFVGQNYTWWDTSVDQWFRWQTWTAEQGYGWLFTGEGKNPILGDVDIYTFNNDTGTYWRSPSPKAGEFAAPTGQPPSPGPDGIPGTCDDGFGDCTADPPGSSVTIIPATLTVETSFDNATWSPLFSVPWPLIFTTATAYDIVNEPTSVINGVAYEADGEPWEFLAGIDHKKEGWNVTWKHPKCNAYHIAACAWSVLNTTSAMGIVDAIYYTRAKLVREDCVIGDLNCDEKVNIKDIGVVAVAFGSTEQFCCPPPRWDKPKADPNWNEHADIMKPRGKINIKDIGRVAIDFGAKLTPQCIIRP